MIWIVAGLVLGAAFTASTQATDETIIAPGGQQENVYWGTAVLPVNFKRVLVLPLSYESSSAELSDGCAALKPVLLADLIKTQKFEVIPADPETLRRLTGRLSWTGAEILPSDFFSSLEKEYDCDAVLFCELTVYEPLPPMEMGWRMKLVDSRTQQILWAVDDIFVARRPNPPDGAWDPYLPNFPIFSPGAHDGVKRNSPRQFGQITLAKLLTSLPYRAESTKVSRRTADVQAGERSKSRR